MKLTNRWMVASAVAVAAVVGAGGSVMAAGDDDAPLTGETRDKAVAAAQNHVGQGRVTETEMGDDGASYGVEILKPDGNQVEVRLDQSYTVTGTEADQDGSGDDERDGD
jgi:uncharacterized membrane protein YkoI